MLNLMLDLEAFGPRPRGLIVSVGVVVFDDELPPERCVLEGDENRFYGVLDSQDARDARFVVDGETMAWWATQGQAFAQLMVEMSTRGERIEALFGRLAAWLSRFKGTPIRHWANAPSYDTVMLENAFQALGIACPLSYKTERDYRTMMELAHGAVRPDVPATGVHNALFDAIEQAKLATAALQKLRAQPAVPLIIDGYPTASVTPALVATAAEVERVVANPAVKSFPSAGASVAATPPGQVKVDAPAAAPVVPNASAPAPAAAQKPAASVRGMDVKTATAVVALDIDGVLQTPALQDWQEMEHAGAVIELLAEMPHLGVLVSATDRETSSPAEVVAMLPAEIARRVVGVTDVTKGGRSDGGRQAEIEAWLAAHPHITTWVAVDDEACLFRQECPWLVQTYKWMGWTDDTTQGVRALLAGRRPEVKLTPSLGRSSSLPANWADPDADPEGDFDVKAMQDKARRDAQEREAWAKNPVPGQQGERPTARSALVQEVLDSPSIIGNKPASKEPPRVLRDRGRALEQNNARPGGWRGLLGIGDKKR
jgi:hypothetical protein